jgi:hypothetical protein
LACILLQERGDDDDQQIIDDDDDITPDAREGSLHVTNTTYSGLQEHRSIVYTATGQKAKPKVLLSTESTVTGISSKTPEACRRETEEHKLKEAV